MRKNQAEESVSVKQIVMIVFLLGMSVKMFMLPVLMLKTSGRDSYLLMAVCLIGELVCLMMLLFTHRICPKKTFFQLLECTFRKVGAKIITTLIALYFFCKLMLVMSEVKIFFTVSVYENLPWSIYFIPFLALMCAVSVKNLRCTARTAEIFTPLIALSAVAICLFLVGNIEFENLLPMFENGIGQAGDSLLRFPLWFGDFSVLIIFLGNIVPGKRMFMAGMLSGGAACVTVLFFAVMIFASYADVNHLLQYGQNISSLTQITTSGFNFGRFDIIIFSIWMISVFILAALMFSTVVRSAEYVCGIDKPYIFSVVFTVILYVVNIFLLPNEVTIHKMATHFFNIPALVMQFAIPLVLLVSAAVCARRQKRRALYDL